MIVVSIKVVDKKGTAIIKKIVEAVDVASLVNFIANSAIEKFKNMGSVIKEYGGIKEKHVSCNIVDLEILVDADTGEVLAD